MWRWRRTCRCSGSRVLLEAAPLHRGVHRCCSSGSLRRMDRQARETVDALIETEHGDEARSPGRRCREASITATWIVVILVTRAVDRQPGALRRFALVSLFDFGCSAAEVIDGRNQRSQVVRAPGGERSGGPRPPPAWRRGCKRQRIRGEDPADPRAHRDRSRRNDERAASAAPSRSKLYPGYVLVEIDPRRGRAGS